MMHYYYADEINGDLAILSDQEWQHILKSMRMQHGDEIWALDGKGTKFRCGLRMKGKNERRAEIIDSVFELQTSSKLHLAIAPTKNPGRLDWLIEKATELGVYRITFLDTKHAERVKINQERVRKIAISALKQSGNLYLPKLSGLTDFSIFVHEEVNSSVQLFIAHCRSKLLPHLADRLVTNQDVLVLVGPEGDFTREEIQTAQQSGFVEISLGNHRLRTETAGIFVTSLVSILNRY